MGEHMTFDIESIRFRGERDYGEALNRLPGVDNLASKTVSDPTRVRRTLMARTLLLSEGMAPGPYRVARELATRLGITEPIEIYQAAGAENAVMHTVPSPVLIEVQGRMLSLLDDDTLAALLGHELGHYLAHGDDNPQRGPALASMVILHSTDAPENLFGAAQRMSMACELTADRVGLIACTGLDAALRLEMVTVTGLAAETLTWDTTAYLTQSRELMEATLAEGATAMGVSHPEHSLRTWALWLFSETDAYQRITGLGPGSRKLADVDDLLLRVLGRPELELGIATALEEPPVEVHECALAACVLVATADGEFHDLEMQAIERVFAPLVSNWRDGLDPERALADFQRLVPLIVVGGERLQRSLFSLLAHVLAVDGECNPAEVEIILAIGGALGCRKLFRDLMPPVLVHFGLELREALDRPDRSIPMPARGTDADAAMAVYFQGVSRRGGGSVTLRRLLRMVGVHRASQETLARISSAAEGNGLQIEPPLGDELDTLHRLDVINSMTTPGIELPAAPVTGTAGEDAERLRRGLTRLRDKLISGDGRSPSIRLQICRPGRAMDLHDLEEVSTGLSERTLALVRGGKRARLVDAAEVGSHDGARRLASALMQIERERLMRFEETGADDLRIGYPFLTGLAGGYLFRAPLILYPVRIESTSRGAGSVSLAVPAGTTPVANQSALRLIFHRKGFAYPDDLAEKADELAAVGPEALLAELAMIGLGAVGSLNELRPFTERREELAGWRDDRLEIEECAVLGLFPQSSSDLMQDYDELLAALNAGTPPISLFACAREVLPGEIKQALLPANPDASSSIPPISTPPIPVLYADPVQRAVLDVAREAPVLVVDGPPGTGKSQVIVNLVADALARGQKIAVVCEKRAALDVVAHRLGSVGLRHLLAVVHDVQEDRRTLYGQVTARFEEIKLREHDAVEREAVAAEAAALMSRLENRSALTTATRDAQAGELALGELHTYAAGLVVGETPHAVDLNQLPLARLEPLATKIAALFPHAGFWRHGSVWRGPDAGPPRASFAGYDNDQARTLMASIIAARDAGKVFEQATTDAQIQPGDASQRKLHALRPALDAVENSRAWRGDAAGRDAFVGLLANDPTVDQVEQTQPAWHALVESRGHRRTDAAIRLFSELIPALATRPDGMSSLQRQAGLWREHSDVLDLFPTPVNFVIDPPLEQALTDARAWASSIWRVLSPTWWRARKVIRAGLAVQWPEKANATLDHGLFALIGARATATRCWRSLADMTSWVAPGARVETLPEARAWVNNAAALAGNAKAISDVRAGMQSLGIWRTISSPDAVSEWDAQAETWIEWHRRARELRPVADALRANSEVLREFNAWPERWVGNTLPAWDRSIDLLRAATSAMETFTSATRPVRALLPWLPERPPATLLAGLVDAWRHDAANLVGADRLLGAAQAVDPSATIFPPFLAERADFGSPAAWADGVRKSWARSSLAAIEALQPEVHALDDNTGAILALDEERLKNLHNKERRLMVDAILHAQDCVPLLTAPQADKGARRTPEQATREAILREAKRQRNILPLRGFVRRFWHKGLLDVLPVWLLSPETATLLFPREPVFDLVIFDEASQCTVENGLPVLMRAHRAVIAGDERQMPPSNFFKSGADDDASGEQDEASVDAREMFDAESLLVLARHRAQHMGLAWHYRCQHEELIAFSNHAIYGGDLNTIPSTISRLAPAALHWVDVPDGRYEDGANIPEARTVVDLVARLLCQDDAPTLGVVTFNLSQRRAILDEIDCRVNADAAFAELWARANAAASIDDRPFVKNLESVQGDERDIIVFSLGHAPVERARRDGKIERYVPARFGPLGQRGGERRLNVAVSRARKEIHVVASFDPHMLSVARSKHDGPRLFKGFLQFAHQLAAGQRNQAEQILKTMSSVSPSRRRPGAGIIRPESWVPLNAQVALALEEIGVKCELDVGSSDFRVPLAIIDAGRPDRYRLGILFDEAVPAGTAFERHVHVPNVLTSRGWKLMRIFSRDWDTRRETVLEEIRRRIAAEATQDEVDVDMTANTNGTPRAA